MYKFSLYFKVSQYSTINIKECFLPNILYTGEFEMNSLKKERFQICNAEYGKGKTE